MATIKVLGKKEIAQVTDMKKVIACVEDVYCQKAKGETVVWPTTFYEFNPGHADMDIKSGYLRGAGIFGHKTVSWFGDNGSKGLPELAGAIGAKYLARKDSKHLLVVGSGNQALYQIAAMLTVFPGLERITVANPLSAQYAQEFVDALPGRLERELGVNYGGVALSAAESPEAALADSDIVITVTPSKAPLIKKEWVKPGTHFSCIGADAEGKEEIAPQIMAGAKIFVGDMSHCVAAGEVEVPIKKRIISEADIIGEIGQLILGERQGRISDSDITIYDATGMALLDLAAAKAARGVATISSGNHGSSVSYAASLLGIKYPTSMLLRPNRVKSFTMMQLMLPARTSSSSSWTAGRSKFVPLYPLSTNSRSSTFFTPSIIISSAYWRRVCRWFSILKLPTLLSSVDSRI